MDKKIKSIALNGLVRNTPDSTTEDGGLLEAINLRFKDGAWRGVGDKVSTGWHCDSLFVLDGIAHHPVLPENTYVVHNTVDNKIYTVLFTNGIAVQVTTLVLTLGVGEVFDRFSYMNNTLLVFTSVKKYLLYWNKDTELYVDLSFLPKPVVKVFDFIDPETNTALAVGESLSFDEAILPDYGYSADNMNEFEYARINVIGDYLKKKADFNKTKKLEGFVMVRVAYKLFDGNYMLASQPILHHIGYHPTKVPQLSLVADGGFAMYHGELAQNYFSQAVFDYNFFNTGAFNLPDHDKMGIIESLDVFSTRPVEAFDYTAPIIDWVLVSGVDLAKIFRPPFNEQQIIDMTTDGQYYKVLSIPIKDVILQREHADSSGLYYFSQTQSYILDYSKDIAANPLLPPDNFTHHEYNSLADFTYNSRIHLGNIINTLSSCLDNTFLSKILIGIGPGNNGFAQTWNTFATTGIRDKFLSTFITPAAPADASKVIYQQVWLNTDEGRKVVTTEITKDFTKTFDAHNIPATFDYYLHTDGATNVLLLNPVITYPDYRAYKMRYYYIYSGTKYFLADYDLKPNTALNTASYFSPLVTTDGSTGNHYPITIPIPATTGTAMPDDDPLTDDVITDTNRVQVSEQSNPFFWPAVNSYRFGLNENTVIAIAGVQSAMSDSAFGQYPLYVFSRSGIYAMQTGNGEVLYQSIQHLNNDILLSRTSLRSISGAIVYATSEGIRIIQGSNSELISKPVVGSITNPLVSAPYFISALSGLNLPNIYSYRSLVPFLTYISGCKIMYDILNEEIIITNSAYLYSYTFNLESKKWATRTEVYTDELIISGRAIAVKLSSAIDGENTVYTTALHYLDQEESSASSLCKYLLLQTRPLNLSSVNIKRIDKLILRANYTNSALEYSSFLVYGSNDLVNYNIITYQQCLQGGDIHTTRLLGNYKYFIVVFACARLNATIQQIDSLLSERFTKMLR